MATLTGKIIDVTGRAPDSISSITVKAPSVRVGGGTDLIVSSPATVDFDHDTGDVTISGLTGGLSWLYLEGEGWSDSIPLAVAEGMITLVEAIANAAGAPGLVDYIELLETLRQNMQDVVTDEFARNSTASVGYAANAGKNVQLDTEGKLNIATSQVTREQDAASKGYVDQRVPIDSFTGTGSPEGRVSAPVGSIYTDSAATNGAIRWVKTSGTGTTGWRVEYGDTGWRNVTGLLMNGWTADQVLVRRQNNTVTLSAFNLSSTEATSGMFISLPGAFHTPKTFVMIDTPAGTRPAFWNLSSSLTVSDYSNFAVSTYASTQTVWQVESDRAWPTSLPGTPA